MLTASTRLGPYEIIAPLGAGGMGEVYRARDTRLGRDVALKVLPEPFASDAGRQARFEREVRSVAALSHPNILAVYDFGTHDGRTYAVMELLEGETLRKRLTSGPLPWPEAIEFGAAIAEGLAAAQAKGIVHRDLKPENLFLTADGRMKILDFGLARREVRHDTQTRTATYVNAETEPGTMMGTVGYMSPEQIRGQPADSRSDIFSFGCVLYEMLTGLRAFRRDTSAETLTAILHDEPPDVTSSGHLVPAELARLIRQCLAKNPNKRLQSARDLALTLRATANHPGLAEPPTQPSVQAIAVLPFENVGGDPATEYLSDGLADQLIISLSQVRREGLKVRPFSSVSRYKRERPELATIGRDLNVRMLVTGTLQQLGDNLSVSVALVDVADDNQLWGKRYQSQLGNVLDLQDEVARDVAASLRLNVTTEEDKRLTKRHTQDPRAYLLYCEARYHFNKFTQDGFTTAIEYCQRAIERDANYAIAHAGIGRTYLLLGSLYQGPRKTYEEGREHLSRALAIDPTLPEAHSGLGTIHLLYDWSWAAAERELKRAIVDDDSSLAPAKVMYCFYLAAMGRLTDEAIAAEIRDVELDPLSAPRRCQLAMCYNLMHKHAEAITEAKKALELDPKYFLAFHELGFAYVQKRMYEEAISGLHEGLAAGNRHPRILGMLGFAYVGAGRRREAKGILEELKEPNRPFGAAYAIARIYTALGDKGQAFCWLRQACDERETPVIWANVDSTMDGLRSDPRFVEIIRSMGLPTEQPAAFAQPASRRSSRLLVGVVAALLLIGVIAAAMYFLSGDGNASQTNSSLSEAAAFEAVAVLPFENDTADSSKEFLSDGIAGHLINSLSRVRSHKLRVRPFTSVEHYKRTETDIPTMGQELNVPVIVTGKLHLQESNLTVDVALIDTRENYQLWGDSYRGKLSGILDLQDEIARDVAAKLRLGLTGEEDAQLTKHYTEDTKAYLLYQEGIHHWKTFAVEGLQDAIKFFNMALEEDPEYALAYDGLGRCYLLLGTLHKGPLLMHPQAREYLLKALDIDPTLADAHAGLACIHLFHDWDWPAAQREAKEAVKFGSATAMYGFFLAAHDRLPEALTVLQRGQEIDPVSAAHRNEVAMCYNWLRDYDKAIVWAEKAIDLNESFFLAYVQRGLGYAQKGMHPEAIAILQTGMSATKGNQHVLGMLGYAYAAAGNTNEARRVLQELTEASKRRWGDAFAIARIHAALGEKVEAFDWLNKACDDREPNVIWIKVDPTLENLHSDQRFNALLRRMNLADATAVHDQAIHSVAVLPFENVGGDPQTEFLSDGVAEQVIQSLSQVRRQDLKIRPFSSVVRYKSQETDVAAAARELNVQAVVTGTLLQQGESLMIRVALANVQDDSHVWGQRYVGTLGDILDLQDEIARDVATNLQLSLTSEEEQRLTKRYTHDPAAYLLYREAMHHFGLITERGFESAIDKCEQAIAKDSQFALAHATLGRCYVGLGSFFHGPKKSHPLGKSHLEDALRIDEALPEAHAAMGLIHLFYEWNWAAAERELKTAIALQSNGGSWAHSYYGFYLAAMDRLPDAFDSIHHGQELDNLAAAPRHHLAQCFNQMRRYKDAIKWAQKALEMDANFDLAHGELGLALSQSNMHREAVETLSKGKRHPWVYGLLGYAHARAGHHAEARHVLEELKSLADKGRFGCKFGIAQIHAALGDKDDAFVWLNTACDERDPRVIWLKVDPTLESLRTDPRFDSLLQRMNLARPPSTPGDHAGRPPLRELAVAI